MCTRPHSVKVKRSLYVGDRHPSEVFMSVPCGNCPECRGKRRLQWVFRLEKEADAHPYKYFVTLTYETKYLPHDGNLYKPDFQNWMKLLRQRKHYENIKYFGCGEYGSKGTERCHWHAIIFSEVPISESDIRATWHYGYVVRISPFASGRAAYVVKYSQKQLLAVYPDGREPPCSLCSRGLGDCWFTPGRIKYFKLNRITEVYTRNHQRIQLPRRYYDIIFSKHERLIFSKDNEQRSIQAAIEQEEKFGRFAGLYRDKRDFERSRQQIASSISYNETDEGTLRTVDGKAFGRLQVPVCDTPRDECHVPSRWKTGYRGDTRADCYALNYGFYGDFRNKH